MKTYKTLIGLILIFGIIYSCEKSDTPRVNKSIVIKTDKMVYDTGERMHIDVTNILEDTVRHFKCDNHDLGPSYILKKEPPGDWIEKRIHYICTQMGPVGYWGTILPSQTKKDSLKIDTTGTYRLKYTFIINSDTTYHLSNEFEIAK